MSFCFYAALQSRGAQALYAITCDPTANAALTSARPFDKTRRLNNANKRKGHGQKGQIFGVSLQSCGSHRHEQKIVGRCGRKAVETAAGTLRDLRIAEVVKLDMTVENGKVRAYRARVALSFKYGS